MHWNFYAFISIELEEFLLRIPIKVISCCFQGHGWCSKQSFCPLSHDIDLIIDVDMFLEGRKSRKRKRRKLNKDNKDMNGTSGDYSKEVDDSNVSVSDDLCEGDDKSADKSDVSELSSDEILKRLKEDNYDTHGNGGHRAGYDAFMTGFIYAVYRTTDNMWKDKTDEWKNKLYLGGKDYPLSVSKSSFSKHSKNHLEKISKIRKSVVWYSKYVFDEICAEVFKCSLN